MFHLCGASAQSPMTADPALPMSQYQPMYTSLYLAVTPICGSLAKAIQWDCWQITAHGNWFNSEETPLASTVR